MVVLTCIHAIIRTWIRSQRKQFVFLSSLLMFNQGIVTGYVDHRWVFVVSWGWVLYNLQFPFTTNLFAKITNNRNQFFWFYSFLWLCVYAYVLFFVVICVGSKLALLFLQISEACWNRFWFGWLFICKLSDIYQTNTLKCYFFKQQNVTLTIISYNSLDCFDTSVIHFCKRLKYVLTLC